MWEQDNKKDWVPKNLCLWTVVLEKTLESPVYCKEIKPVSPKRHQPWIFILEKEMATHYSILPGESHGQRSLAGYSPWGLKESVMTGDLALSVHWKDCRWSSNLLSIWCEELTQLKRPWCWERLKVGGEGDDRGWDGWMASLTQWTWVWVNSRRWWWTGRPGLLQSMGSQSWTQLSDWTTKEPSQSGQSLSLVWLYNPMNRSTPGLHVHHQLLEFTQTHVHWVGDAIKTSHPLLSPSPPAFNLPQHQGLFKRVSSSHQVAKVLEFQLQHQSFQWTPRTDLL